MAVMKTRVTIPATQTVRIDDMRTWTQVTTRTTSDLTKGTEEGLMSIVATPTQDILLKPCTMQTATNGPLPASAKLLTLRGPRKALAPAARATKRQYTAMHPHLDSWVSMKD